MKTLLAILFITVMSGCGQFSRGCAKWTGHDIVCVEGVKYIQFTSGVSPQYNPDGSIVTCK